jgi:hypothetical protein
MLRKGDTITMGKISIRIEVDEEDVQSCKTLFVVMKDSNGLIISGNYIDTFAVLPATKMEELLK